MVHPGLRRIAEAVLPLSYRPPFVRALSSRFPLALLYHSVPRRNGAGMDEGAFERQLLFLKQYCDFVTQEELGERRKPLDRIQVVLTFDDGMRNHATVVAPILRRHKVPAQFFVCSRSATPGQYLWFVYLRAFERHFAGTGVRFRGELLDMSPAHRRRNVQRLRAFLLTLTPHPAAMYRVIEDELPRLEDFVSKDVIADSYAGMTAEQTGELAASPLFSVGVHTVDHPLLTKCTAQDMAAQIQRNKTWIESICNVGCDSIAYPGGDYNRAVIDSSRQVGIVCGYAIIPNAHGNSPYDIPRVGVYATSLAILGFKAHWGHYIRRLRLRVG